MHTITHIGYVYILQDTLRMQVLSLGKHLLLHQHACLYLPRLGNAQGLHLCLY